MTDVSKELLPTDGFHWRDGIYFQRLDGGSVRVHQPGGVFKELFTIPSNEWKSIVDYTRAAPDVEKVARAICGRGMEWRGCESDCHAAGKCVGTLSECVIDDAKAAITAMRGGE